MEIEIHQLQKSSPKLLAALYADKRLPLTPAIAAISNNYYPSIEQILDTLQRYSDVDIVIMFANENATAIEAAKTQIEENKVASIALNTATEIKPLENPMEIPNAQSAEERLKELTHRPLKTVTIEQIESAISKALLELTGQKYEVDVKRLDFDPGSNAWIYDEALLDLRVTKNRLLDPVNLF